MLMPGSREKAMRRTNAVRGALGVLVLAIGLLPEMAAATISLSATRVIVHGEEREGGLIVSNQDPLPALVQAWVDDGRPEQAPETIATPFQLLPPLVRIEPKGNQRIRVLVVRPELLPADKESLYWLNVVEVPRKEAGAEDASATGAPDFGAQLKVVVRTRLKLIHRPAGLKGEPADGVARLEWRSSADGRRLSISNPSLWVINLASIAPTGLIENAVLGDGSIAPQATRTFELARPVQAGQAIEFEWVDDHGVARKARAVVRPR